MSGCAHCSQENPAGARYCLACGAALRDVRESTDTRKTVTVLFCDIVDSTPLGERLDAEAHRRVIGRYFDAVRGVIDGHGGTVEKFIGDAVMAVFGIPTVHEDDALRAVRAASEIREAVAPLDRELESDYGVRLRVRVGAATGEVLAGDPSGGQAFATGDTVVVAERLEKAARPNDVLIADATYRLVADAVIAEPVEPVQAKGKAVPVAAWRVVGVQPGALGVARRFDTPLVGRRREVAAMGEAFDQAVAERRCRLVTVLGAAGLGKSRLVRQFLLDAGPEANVLVGRCLPYGDGITFWPISEVFPDETFTGTTDEIFWRIRKRVEELARERPLVLCFDDVHWAEPTFLNLIEYLHGWIADAPVLLLCLARPDLNDHHPAWLAPHGDTVVLTLTPLSGDEVATLIGALDAPREARERIAEAAEGNPLFVEQMAAMAAEEGPGFVVPPTIRALLAARLDRLSADERAVVERGAVFGRQFPLRAVVDLAPEDLRAQVAGILLGLMRKEFLSPAVIAFVEEDGFRFRHALIREVAYEAISKQVRSDLHERCARWLERNGGDDVIVGYHLEQAFQAREQIGRVDDEARELAREAGELLGDAGQRAFARDDTPATVNLLGRALALLPRGHPSRLQLMRQLSTAYFSAGAEKEAKLWLTRLLEEAIASGDRGMEWWARLGNAFRHNEPETDEAKARLADDAISAYEELGDHRGLAGAWQLKFQLVRNRSRWREAQEAIERAIGHARRTGDPRTLMLPVDRLCGALLHGPVPAEEGISTCEQLLAETDDGSALEASVSSYLAGLRAMRGEFDEARRLLARAEEVYSEVGLRIVIVNVAEILGWVELLAGDPGAAEAALRRGYDIVADSENPSLAAPLACLLAEASIAQGQLEQAAEFARVAEQGLNDVDSQIRWRRVRARVDAERGSIESAVQVAREAVELATPTDGLVMHADALVDLARVMAIAGRPSDADVALRQAVELYERKGNVVAAEAAGSLANGRAAV